MLGSSIVSPRIYSLVLTSPRLKRMLLPEGLLPSPYEVLKYESTLVLHDGSGKTGTIQRTQQIRFLQDRVSAILDHVWGDGVVLTSYHNEAGNLRESFRDVGKRHLVIGLGRPMRRGETLTFKVRRRAMVGFMEDEEWLETIMDHPTRYLSRSIVFPKERPCLLANLDIEGQEFTLPIRNLPGGRTLVGFHTATPRVGTLYTIRWIW